MQKSTLPIQKMQVSSQDNHLLATTFLHSNCGKIPGLGPKSLERLMLLGIECLQDLLWHLPRQFEDRRHISSLSNITQLIGQKAQFDLLIDTVQVTQGKTPRLLAHCIDGRHNDHLSITLVFFKPQRNQIQLYQPGQKIRVFGEVGFYQQQGEQVAQMTHPQTQFLKSFDDPLPTALSPIYPSVQGLSQNQWRKWMSWLFEQLQAAPFNIDLLADIDNLQQISLLQAFEQIHQGEHTQLDQAGHLQINRQHKACQRIILEELIAHQLLCSPQTRQAQSQALQGQQEMIAAHLARLPFTMTSAQQRSLQEITQDLSTTKTMVRLLQGDVGSGKTLVAALAAALAATQGSQVAVLAPTEILARQHYQAFRELLLERHIGVALLTGKIKTQERQMLLEKIKSGACNIIIGTHALFQRDVEYNNLDLVIIDEQHRFGVSQRTELLQKGVRRNHQGLLLTPHQLMMSATPIPRTLTMSIYAQLDTSCIDELPPNRKPVTTRAISEAGRDKLYERVKAFIATGQQVFWICAIIQDSEHSGEKKSIETVLSMLQQALPEIKMDNLHGQLNELDKAMILERFVQGEIQLLVATSMVEVGINIPNANVMIVEDAQNWGLTQLHQLRGRVGRGSKPGYMLLLHRERISTVAYERLSILRQSQDGFIIADKDLEIRGPGDISGVAQSGHTQFKLLDLVADQALFTLAKDISTALKANSPDIAHNCINRYKSFSKNTLQT